MRPEPTRPRIKSVRRPCPRQCGTALAFALAAALGAATCGADTVDLDAPITATWAGIGLRAWAARLANEAGVAIVVDRRLDPDAPISLECRDEPLRNVLGRAAVQAGGEPAVLGSSIRIVPPGAADLSRRAEQALHASLAKLPAAQKSLVDARLPWTWPAASRPRDLVVAAAVTTGVVIEGAESLPHDHLPATTLPPLSLAERLDLVLAQYDRRIAWRPGAAGRPVGRIIAIDADLPPPDADGSLPGPGTIAGGSKPRRPAATARSRDSTGGRERDTFSLRVAAPLDKVLAAIATRLEVDLEIDLESLRRRGVAPGEMVKATVEKATREELLDAILDPLQLEWKIVAGTLRVSARPEPR